MANSSSQANQETRNAKHKVDWKQTLGSLFGSNIRETIADVRAIREGFRQRKAAKIASEKSAAK